MNKIIKTLLAIAIFISLGNLSFATVSEETLKMENNYKGNFYSNHLGMEEVSKKIDKKLLKKLEQIEVVFDKKANKLKTLESREKLYKKYGDKVNKIGVQKCDNLKKENRICNVLFYLNNMFYKKYYETLLEGYYKKLEAEGVYILIKSDIYKKYYKKLDKVNILFLKRNNNILGFMITNDLGYRVENITTIYVNIENGKVFEKLKEYPENSNITDSSTDVDPNAIIHNTNMAVRFHNKWYKDKDYKKVFRKDLTSEGKDCKLEISYSYREIMFSQTCYATLGNTIYQVLIENDKEAGLEVKYFHEIYSKYNAPYYFDEKYAKENGLSKEEIFDESKTEVFITQAYDINGNIGEILINLENSINSNSTDFILMEANIYDIIKNLEVRKLVEENGVDKN